MRRLLLAAAIIGGAGLGLVAVGYVSEPRRAAFAYLTAFLFWISIALGGLILVMCAHVTRARWFVLLRRLTETVAATLPAFALLFVPLAFALGHVYPWVHPEAHALEPHAREALEHRAVYQSVPFFLARSAAYFAIWIAIAELLRRWSLRQDADPGAALTDRQRKLSAAGIPPLALALTFAAFDWVMSLDPVWYSTAFGLYLFSGAFVGALAAVAVIAHATARAGVLAHTSPWHFYAVGRLLFAFVIFWAYIAFSQFFVIYMADLPEEVSWYLARVRGSWGAVAALVVAGNFVLPFLTLISRDLKRNPTVLAGVGAWILLAHYADIYWLVVPVIEPAGFSPHWLDLAALLGVGGAAAAFGLWRLSGKALVPKNDPLFEASLRYSDPL